MTLWTSAYETTQDGRTDQERDSNFSADCFSLSSVEFEILHTRVVLYYRGIVRERP